MPTFLRLWTILSNWSPRASSWLVDNSLTDAITVSDRGHLHASWVTSLLQRIACHESMTVRRWGVMTLLTADYTACPFFEQQVEVRFTIYHCNWNHIYLLFMWDISNETTFKVSLKLWWLWYVWQYIKIKLYNNWNRQFMLLILRQDLTKNPVKH